MSRGFRKALGVNWLRVPTCVGGADGAFVYGVGNLFTSLIHTCELSGASPFDDLTELQRHAAALKGNAARHSRRRVI